MQDKETKQMWLDDQVWLDLLEQILLENPALADRAAKLWNYLLVELESGPEGRNTCRAMH